MSCVLDVAIVGAGCSGICMGIKLKQAKVNNFKIFEKSGGISGTWHDNTYPGAACDVPSHLYCYSFELNPEWSRVFSPQPEIKAYFEKCIEKYGIASHLQLQTEIVSAVFDGERALWQIHTASGEEILARFFVSAAGALTIPFLPDIKGIDDFTGSSFHSARWDHSCELENKNVAVVGSAASAVQIVPAIAEKVKKLYMFQRTANYILPRFDRAYSEEEKQKFRKSAWRMRLLRWRIYWFMEGRFKFFQRGSAENSKETYLALKNMKKYITDEELQKKLTPQYAMGCKRVLLSDDFYPALTRENVAVITPGIQHVTANEIVTEDEKKLPVDVIVFATGFQVDKFMNFDIVGLDGKKLQDVWQSRPISYFGITVSGFPNFFMLLGPNTGLGHNSIIFMIESQVNYILQCMKKLGKRKYIDVKEQAMKKHDEELHAHFAGTVWSDCKSWYQNSDGKIIALWPQGTVDYWKATRKPKFRNFVFK
ncbi:flavin-containing monooxygenase [Candidatus Uabimicrobium amorphum]|uniref:Flavin-binding monooxygenase n=1 Tax=Uabimicrobium amorphum TaxID=2596890 RepID=A0A5S9ILR7_UABAM|nr:NAD(P)/FAD-dependent oxidoreductase [Candidatus Uabimicrobium amorphum]BBM84228.1 flavin-binding monooxygenase [Candidatus Uabimicrobium amorphum]